MGLLLSTAQFQEKFLQQMIVAQPAKKMHDITELEHLIQLYENQSLERF
jgi:hypothetical protein